MKQQEAETLAHACSIGRAVIMASPEGGWEVYLYNDDYHSISRTKDAVETARGELRNWSSLDTAHKWIRALPTPVRIRIEIDG